jgi:hypothetical protein
MTDKKGTASDKILEHVKRARQSLDNIDRDGTTVGGVLRNPPVQGAALKVAAEELKKAIAIMKRTKWK